jgi:hypothetical protein
MQNSLNNAEACEAAEATQGTIVEAAFQEEDRKL